MPLMWHRESFDKNYRNLIFYWSLTGPLSKAVNDPVRFWVAKGQALQPYLSLQIVPCNFQETSVSKGRYSTSGSKPEKYSESRSCITRKSFGTFRHGSSHSPKELFPFVEPVNPYYQTALDYYYCLLDRSQLYDDEVTSQNAQKVRRAEQQLKQQVFDSSKPVSILSVLQAIQMACNTNGTHKTATMCFSIFYE